MTNSKKTFLTHANVLGFARRMDACIIRVPPGEPYRPKVYPIPRGGIYAAYALLSVRPELYSIVDTPAEADIFVDDIIDSGETMRSYCDAFPGKPFYALVDNGSRELGWVVFPWENVSSFLSSDDTVVGTVTNRLRDGGVNFYANSNISAFLHDGELEQIEDELAVRAEYFLRGLIIDVDRDHNTKGTAHRIARMYMQEVFKGRYTPQPPVTSFPNARKLDDMYILGPITVRSACSHHFVPITGKCWIGVLPGNNVIGLSKFTRLVDWLASRPQIQEELVMQIADAVESATEARGVAVVLDATHMCMTWRGVKEPESSKMTSSVMRGMFLDNPALRGEFMSLVSGK